MSRRMRKCSIDGCRRKHVARGFCRPHYQRWYRTREPLQVASGDGVRRPHRSIQRTSGPLAWWQTRNGRVEGSDSGRPARDGDGPVGR